MKVRGAPETDVILVFACMGFERSDHIERTKNRIGTSGAVFTLNRIITTSWPGRYVRSIRRRNVRGVGSRVVLARRRSRAFDDRRHGGVDQRRVVSLRHRTARES